MVVVVVFLVMFMCGGGGGVCHSIRLCGGDGGSGSLLLEIIGEFIGGGGPSVKFSIIGGYGSRYCGCGVKELCECHVLRMDGR